MPIWEEHYIRFRDQAQLPEGAITVHHLRESSKAWYCCNICATRDGVFEEAIAMGELELDVAKALRTLTCWFALGMDNTNPISHLRRHFKEKHGYLTPSFDAVKKWTNPRIKDDDSPPSGAPNRWPGQSPDSGDANPTVTHPPGGLLGHGFSFEFNRKAEEEQHPGGIEQVDFPDICFSLSSVGRVACAVCFKYGGLKSVCEFNYSRHLQSNLQQHLISREHLLSLTTKSRKAKAQSSLDAFLRPAEVVPVPPPRMIDPKTLHEYQCLGYYWSTMRIGSTTYSLDFISREMGLSDDEDRE